MRGDAGPWAPPKLARISGRDRRAAEQVRDGGLAEKRRHAVRHLFPPGVSRTGGAVTALRTSEQTAAPLVHAIEGGDDLVEPQPRRGYRQLEAPGLAARRDEHPDAGEEVQDLGQVVLGDAEGAGHLGHPYGAPVAVLGEVEHRAQRVFGGLREHKLPWS